MRTQLIAATAAFLFCAPALTSAQVAAGEVVSTTFTTSLAGAWRAAPDEMRLTSAFDESVWGRDAKSVRIVELNVTPTGDGTIKVTRSVVDARGRTVPASTSHEEARIVIGGSRRTVSTRIEHDVKVVSATRTYPDDPGHTWDLAGLKIELVTFEDGDGSTLEVRFDTPEGRGSFWETLRRQGRAPAG
jgi:hypothetical protein